MNTTLIPLLSVFLALNLLGLIAALRAGANYRRQLAQLAENLEQARLLNHQKDATVKRQQDEINNLIQVRRDLDDQVLKLNRLAQEQNERYLLTRAAFEEVQARNTGMEKALFDYAARIESLEKQIRGEDRGLGLRAV